MTSVLLEHNMHKRGDLRYKELNSSQKKSVQKNEEKKGGAWHARATLAFDTNARICGTSGCGCYHGHVWFRALQRWFDRLPRLVAGFLCRVIGCWLYVRVAAHMSHVEQSAADRSLGRPYQTCTWHLHMGHEEGCWWSISVGYNGVPSAMPKGGIDAGEMSAPV